MSQGLVTAGDVGLRSEPSVYTNGTPEAPRRPVPLSLAKLHIISDLPGLLAWTDWSRLSSTMFTTIKSLLGSFQLQILYPFHDFSAWSDNRHRRRRRRQKALKAEANKRKFDYYYEQARVSRELKMKELEAEFGNG